ncbi:MAG: dolichyl-phosphate beta-glucosyltransferase [Patescibacteria group bacterium]|nr:dolichyl-phosphate beta-glucosyltransferase [Patescibacteria group bacterium]
MEEKIYLSVIIPAYNEENRIKDTLLKIDKFLTARNYNYEIIVVDDGSCDGTVNLVQDLQKSIPELKIISNQKNYGKGYAVRQGILKARGEFRLFMDADNATDIEQIRNFLPFFQKGYEIVIGNRDLQNSQIKEHQPFYRELLGDLGNFLIQLLVISGIRDTQCGFKCFSEKFVEDIFPKLEINRWGFDIEILILAKKNNYKIKAVPVIWTNDVNSKVTLNSYLGTLKELLQIKWGLIKGKYK